jgi:hypothetical protein
VRLVGECDICRTATNGSDARRIDEMIVCNACFSKSEQIWCPACCRSFEQGGYLRCVFFDDRPGFHAAALVTHYRHEHVRSYDLAWQSRRYASKIPHYDYDSVKEQVNNRAKRQLIRAIARLLKKNEYPQSAPIGAMELIRAFDR